MSRLLGFLRDILIARYVGTGVVADAFLAAFRFPNMFRRIFGEGAFNSAFVPLFGKRVVEDGRAMAMKFANNAFSSLFAVLGVLTLIMIPLMGWVMLAVVPGFKAGYEETGNGAEKAFRVSLNGARAVFFETTGNVELENLRVVERGDPPTEEVVKELFGGETAADGGEVPLEVALQGGLKRKNEVKKGESEEEVAARVFEDGTWKPGKDGELRVPLPPDHNFSVMEGTWKGASGSELKIFRNDPGAFDLAVKLGKITFIYLLCMALVAHLSGVLNTLKKFAAPAFSPVLLNIVFLVGLLFFVKGSQNQGEILAWCVAVAGFVQLGMLWWSCRRAGLPVGVTVPKLTPQMKRLFWLMGPGVAAAGIQQVNLLVGGIIASFQQGAISFLYYSDRVYQLPLGMIGIAFGVVLLPEISRLLKSGNEEGAKRTMTRGIEFSMLVTIPATVALILMAHEIIAVCFERGDFTPDDTRQTGAALAGFAIGLPAFVLIKVLQPGYFAREDTKTPMYMAGATVLVNIVVSLILFVFYGHVGIAVATSIAAWVNVILLWGGLRKMLAISQETVLRIGAMVAASGLMGLLLWGAKIILQPWFQEAGWQKFTALFLLIGMGSTAYGLGALLLRATSLKELRGALKR